MINADYPVYAPTSGIIYAKHGTIWLEAENGVSSITAVWPKVITGQKVISGQCVAMTGHQLHWEYQPRRACEYCRNPRNLAQVDVSSGSPEGRAYSGGWRLCQHCFGESLSLWRRQWLNDPKMAADWEVRVYSHLSRRPIAVLAFKGERQALRVVRP